jgi:hypothetical protein
MKGFFVLMLNVSIYVEKHPNLICLVIGIYEKNNCTKSLKMIFLVYILNVCLVV